MMKNLFSAAMGCGALLIFAAGCGPELAQLPMGPDETEWDREIRKSYPSFRPPRTPAPASYQRQAPEAPAAVTEKEPLPPMATDPAAVVDKAAEGKSVKPVPETQAPAEQKAPESAIQSPAPEKKADAKSPAGKADAKAEEGKAPAGKADAIVPAEGTVYVVRPGDTLGGIARRIYGRSSLDDVIFKANTQILKNRNALRPGMKLVIPKL